MPDFNILDEVLFRNWYNQVAMKYGLSLNPDDPRHQGYDYRAAYKNGIREPEWQPEHGDYRWPDKLRSGKRLKPEGYISKGHDYE